MPPLAPPADAHGHVVNRRSGKDVVKVKIRFELLIE